MTDTPRLGLPYPVDADPADVPTWMRNLALELDGYVPMDMQGAIGSRPAAGVQGRYYTSTNEGAGITTYRDDGTSWRKFNYIPRVTGPNLPASPPDGDEVLWQYDAAFNPAIAWHMRWNAAISRWEYLGGSPIVYRSNAEVSNAGQYYPAYATAGPTWPLPKSGSWNVRWGGFLGVAGGPAGALNAFLAVLQGGVLATLNAQVQGVVGTAVEVERSQQLTGTKGQVLTVALSSFNPCISSASSRWIELSPIIIQND
jgi:hypothetical protein